MIPSRACPPWCHFASASHVLPLRLQAGVDRSRALGSAVGQQGDEEALQDRHIDLALVGVGQAHRAQHDQALLTHLRPGLPLCGRRAFSQACPCQGVHCSLRKCHTAQAPYATLRHATPHIRCLLGGGLETASSASRVQEPPVHSFGSRALCAHMSRLS